MHILDLFEGDEYLRTDIIAQEESGKNVNAATYVAAKETFDTFKPLLSNEWNYGHFRTNHLDSFLKMCAEFNETEIRK